MPVSWATTSSQLRLVAVTSSVRSRRASWAARARFSGVMTPAAATDSRNGATRALIRATVPFCLPGSASTRLEECNSSAPPEVSSCRRVRETTVYENTTLAAALIDTGPAAMNTIAAGGQKSVCGEKTIHPTRPVNATRGNEQMSCRRGVPYGARPTKVAPSAIPGHHWATGTVPPYAPNADTMTPAQATTRMAPASLRRNRRRLGCALSVVSQPATRKKGSAASSRPTFDQASQ